MDKLKQYLQEHRQELDIEMPPADLLPHIHAGAVAPTTTAMLIKYIITISVLTAIGTGAWLLMHKQKPTYTPAPVAPQKEVIQKDTVPVQKDTTQAQPAIKYKKTNKVPPSPPVIRKHKKSADTAVRPIHPRKKKHVVTVNHPTPPRKKKKGVIPIT
jgi:hypothetical protein